MACKKTQAPCRHCGNILVESPNDCHVPWPALCRHARVGYAVVAALLLPRDAAQERRARHVVLKEPIGAKPVGNKQDQSLRRRRGVERRVLAHPMDQRGGEVDVEDAEDVHAVEDNPQDYQQNRSIHLYFSSSLQRRQAGHQLLRLRRPKHLPTKQHRH